MFAFVPVSLLLAEDFYGLCQSQHAFIAETNRIYDGVEAETRKSHASFQII